MISGMPEGIELVDVREPEEGEFFFWKYLNIDKWENGCRAEFKAIVIQAAPGYEMFFDKNTEHWISIRHFEPFRTITVEFTARNSREWDAVYDIAQKFGAIVKQTEN